jgi:ABC-2 type transport system permease protein
MQEKGSFLQVLQAAAAVCRRILLTYFRYPTFLIALVVWPIVYPFAYIFVCEALAGPDNMAVGTFVGLAGTDDYTSYIVIGAMFWWWFNMILWGFGSSLRQEQVRGTLESNWLAPAPKVFLLLGSAWADLLLCLGMLGISWLSGRLLYGVRMLGSIWHLLTVVAASIPSIYGIGVIFASLVLVAKETNSFVYFTRGLITVFSGITYPIAVLPGWMSAISRALPLTHSINAVRAIAIGNSLGAVSSELQYLLISGAVLLSAGLLIFFRVQRHMLTTGTVGQY